jgi:hypothetical protein
MPATIVSGAASGAAGAEPIPRFRQGRLYRTLVHLAGGALGRILGTADGPAVGVIAVRELALILRSRGWSRFLGMWVVYCSCVLALPLLFRGNTGRWLAPSNITWCLFCAYSLQLGLAVFMAKWSISRLRRDLYSERLDELMLTRCSPADIAMGEGVAAILASVWLAAAAIPVALWVADLAGRGPGGALRLFLSLPPAAGLGVWFGMGWGLAFTLRRSAAIVPLTKWWLLGPFLPIWLGWSLLGLFPVLSALASFIPGGLRVISGILSAGRWAVLNLVQHWNPVLTVGGALGAWSTIWVTDWLALLLVLAFMARKSMDAMQLALATLPERGTVRPGGEYWVHHDRHHFLQFTGGKRPEPEYRDDGNPIAAFDVALGHRVYLHPFFWCLAFLLYLFTLFWSLLVPDLGQGTAIVAVLTPATGALLLMSGGVAVSFGWERDQHRWPALAVLPMNDLRLALGKVKGVVRPTLWISLVSSLTALLMGWRGALHWEASLWTALHVVLFPLSLAGVAAALALTTPTVSEALYRWLILGAIPTVATFLPHPVGGDAGIALPFIPPLLVLLLVIQGPEPALIRGAWIALGLEVTGILGALLILGLLLRRWTVGERD